MQKKVIGYLLNKIGEGKNYTKDELDIIEYGLASIYLTFSKLIVILLLSFVLNIFNEVVIFLVFCSIIRLFGFGLHATKSYICLIVSTTVFIGCPLMLRLIDLNIYIKIILFIINILFIIKNSPADTHKRPIVSKKRRMIYKILCTIVSIIYFIISFKVSTYISNCLLCSLIVQNVLMAKTTYKLFNLPYNNYKNYK